MFSTEQYYLYKNFEITVVLLKGKSQCEIIEKMHVVDGNTQKSRLFSDDEVKAWLDTNSMGHDWVLDKEQDTSTHKYWTLFADGKEMAGATLENATDMSFMTMDYFEAFQKARHD